MAPSAGYLGNFYASTDNSTWAEFALMTDADAQLMRDLLETTNFKNAGSTPEKERIYGLGDASFSLTFHFDDSDTNGQKAIRTALLNRSVLYIKCLFDGTNGFSCQVLVENIGFKSGVGSIADMSASLKKTGALTAI